MPGEGEQGVDVIGGTVQRVLGPVELGLGALVRAVVGRVAVAPEGDLVEVVEAEQGRRQVYGDAVIGALDDSSALVVLEKVVDGRLAVVAEKLLGAGVEDRGLVDV